MKLGHVHLKVRSLPEAERFYTTALGLKVTERIGRHFVFLSFGEAHHDVALQALGESARPPAPGTVGLYHSAFEVPGAAALLSALSRLDELGVRTSLVDHGLSWAIYTHDPDGNGVEIYLDRRESHDGRTVWSGRSYELTRDDIRAASDQ
jgi:catechol 2,3-dioxygenase